MPPFSAYTQETLNGYASSVPAESDNSPCITQAPLPKPTRHAIRVSQSLFNGAPCPIVKVKRVGYCLSKPARKQASVYSINFQPTYKIKVAILKSLGQNMHHGHEFVRKEASD